MQVTPQIHIIDGVTAPKGGWKFRVPPKHKTSGGFYHSSYYRFYSPSLLIDSSGLTMIEAGPPESLPQIKAFVESLGHKMQQVKSIIVSHAAADHVGVLKQLTDATGAKVYAHEIEAPYIQKELLDTRDYEAAHVDVRLKDGDFLDIFGGLEIIFTPGHSPGHIVIYSRKHKVLFAGGLIRTFRNNIILANPKNTDEYTVHLVSMLKVAHYDFDILIPYQGEPIIGGAGEKYREFIEYLKAISDIFIPEIREALAPETEG